MVIDREAFKIEPDDDDDGLSVMSLATHLEEDSERKKSKTALEFNEMGGKYLKEINIKKSKKGLKQRKLIPYVLKHCSGIYDEEDLMSYSFEDVQKIYDELKIEKKPFIIKFFHFLFNID